MPTRRPGTLRRTMHVDVGPRRSWGAPLPMAGAARDAATEASGALAVLDEARAEADFDAERRLARLHTDPAEPWAAALLGERVGGGFRAALAGAVPPEASGSLLRQVLDDLPAAALISGYAWMRRARHEGGHPAAVLPDGVVDRMRDLCSGWRAGGTALSSVGSGAGVPVQDTPPAPDLADADPLGWHAMDVLGEDWMRRRRLLDVAVEGSGRFEVWAMFRDTVGDGGGAELVLHEYAVELTGSAGAVGELVAHPRVLPFGECPAAADSVGALAGVALGDLPRAVPERLRGVACCTHLNDLLRSLSGVATLVSAAANRSVAGRS